MLTHEYFEELCALAASGQISEPELLELQDHIEDCAECRSAEADFIDLLHHKLPLLDSEQTGSSRLAGFSLRNSSYRERFLARARKQGLAISHGSLRESFRSRLAIWLWTGLSYTQFATLAMTLLMAAVGILGYSLRQTNARNRTLAADMTAMSTRLGQQSHPEASPAQTRETPSTPPAALPSNLATETELAKARQDHASVEARSAALEAQLQTAASELEALRTQHEQANDSRNQLEKKLTDAELALARASDELRRIRQGRSEDVATIDAQSAEIRKLAEKLSAQTETLERERTLLAAGRDIHDLMGARNLHVVDVLDVDSRGKDKRAFGRVFYTEGKSLIFYAFDLGDRTAQKRNASFQVWGTGGPAQSRAQNLGIFYVDDQKQRRWVLKFEEPRILAEIDSVFVTVEPPGGSARPTGRKFLYAYLKANPNHP